jgi:predicted ATPase
MAMLKRLVLKGFKSIREMDLELRPLNVLIGANGAGKSNLISFFRMLNEMTGIIGMLRDHVVIAGGAQSLLYYGPEVTSQVEARLDFDMKGDDSQACTYQFRLTHAPDEGDSSAYGDRFVFSEETLILRDSPGSEPRILSLGAGHEEAEIVELAQAGEPTAMAVLQLLKGCRVYHFHDVTLVDRHDSDPEGRFSSELRPDAGNLASFLYRLKQRTSSVAYQRIVRTIGRIAPFFQDFHLEPKGPENKEIELKWRDKESGRIFGAHQLSDGTLRAMCLVTLLLQPEKELPPLIIVDEPELGLHPYALNLIASLFKKASHHTQILITTQSSPFLDQFDSEDIIIVDRVGRESVFHRPDPVALDSWLDEYSLGEVWEKNMIGGGPR